MHRWSAVFKQQTFWHTLLSGYRRRARHADGEMTKTMFFFLPGFFLPFPCEVTGDGAVREQPFLLLLFLVIFVATLFMNLVSHLVSEGLSVCKPLETVDACLFGKNTKVVWGREGGKGAGEGLLVLIRRETFGALLANV